MKINIKLMGVLKDKTPADGTLDVPDGATIEEALRVLDISAETVQVCTVNGTLERNLQRTLAADDELSVVPPVGGG
ncbi:MAG: MoaD/ThiS family protein [Planctomycetota bacterium]|nr:MoaD/ThiS family protein [Planctomycetota bacterium]